MAARTAGSCGAASGSSFCSKAISLTSCHGFSHIRGKTEVAPSYQPSKCWQDLGYSARVP